MRSDLVSGLRPTLLFTLIFAALLGIVYPLVVLVIFFGVYPAPVFDATTQSVKALVTNVTASINSAQTAAAN